MNARAKTQPMRASSVLQTDAEQSRYMAKPKPAEAIAKSIFERYDRTQTNQKVLIKQEYSEEADSITIDKPLSPKKDGWVDQFEKKHAMVGDRVQRRNVAILGAILALSLIVAVVSLVAAYVLVETSAILVAGLAFMSAAIAVYKAQTMFDKYELELIE